MNDEQLMKDDFHYVIPLNLSRRGNHSIGYEYRPIVLKARTFFVLTICFFHIGSGTFLKSAFQVEIKHVNLAEGMCTPLPNRPKPSGVQRTKVIHTEGEMQTSEKLLEAARIRRNNPRPAIASHANTHRNCRRTFQHHCFPSAD